MQRIAFNISVFLLSCTLNLYSQITIPDTVCVNEKVEISSTETFESICITEDINFLNYEISIQPLVNYPENEVPLFSHFVQDENGNHFGFFTNFTSNNVTRLAFGDNLLNTPSALNLPINEIEGGMEGIQIVNDNNQWWGFIVGGNGIFDDEYFLRLNFGNSLSNSPTIENLGAIGGISFPHDLFFFKENSNWIGLTINKFNNTITRFEFGDNLSNMPIATNLGNISNLVQPTGFFPIRVAGDWHLFITQPETNTLTRLDFMDSLTDTPFSIDLGTFDLLDKPRDILVVDICNQYFGFVLNRTNSEIILLEFGNDITSIPIGTSLGNFGDFSFPHSISNLQVTSEGFVFFVTNVDTKEVVRVLYQFPQNLNTGCNESLSDFNVVYNLPGNYQIEVTTNLGLPDQMIFCKDIVVVDFCEPCFTFPNVFTPNQDGANDIFRPVSNCEVEVQHYQLEIYNRWGNKVFETNNPQIGWDGFNGNKELASEVYAWVASFSFVNGVDVVEETMKGNVTLIR